MPSNGAKTDLLVFHITDVFPPSIGGIETALGTLLPRLIGVQSVVLVDSVNVADPESAVGNVRVVPVSGRRGLWRLLQSPSIERVLAGRSPSLLSLLWNMARQDERSRLLSRAPADSVLHFHGLGWLRRFDPATEGLRGLFNAFVVRRFFRAVQDLPAAVYTDHSLFSGPYDRFVANAGPAFLANVRAIVTVERSGFENAKRWARESGEDKIVRLIPNPVDLDRFAWRQRIPSQTFTLGYVGRVSKPGLPLLSTLWASAPDWARLVLCLARDREMSIGLPPSVRSMLASPSTEVLWDVPQEEMPRVLASVDTLLDPFEVGTPRTTIEALAVGRPVIRFRESQSNAEPLIPDELAPLVLSSEPLRAWQLIEAWRNRPEEHLRLCTEARRFATSTFDAAMIAAEYRALYQELLSS